MERQGDVASILEAFGGLLAFTGVVALTLLAVLLPWFVWRIKVYVKRCFLELERLNKKR